MWSAAHDLSKIGKNKYAVNFISGSEANKFVSGFHSLTDRITADDKWIAYIPNFKVVYRFILRGAGDDNDNPEDIKFFLKPHPNWNFTWEPPFEVTRIKKRVRDPDPDSVSDIPNISKIVNSDLYELKFRTMQVPKFAIYMGKKVSISPFFYQARRCTKCQRFGHATAMCRTSEEGVICEICAGRGHLGTNCPRPEKVCCINCIRAKLTETAHKASDNKCLCYIKQKKINRITAVNCVSPRYASLNIHKYKDDGTLTESSPLRDSLEAGFGRACLGDFIPPALSSTTTSSRPTWGPAYFPEEEDCETWPLPHPLGKIVNVTRPSLDPNALVNLTILHSNSILIPHHPGVPSLPPPPWKK